MPIRPVKVIDWTNSIVLRASPVGTTHLATSMHLNPNDQNPNIPNRSRNHERGTKSFLRRRRRRLIGSLCSMLLAARPPSQLLMSDGSFLEAAATLLNYSCPPLLALRPSPLVPVDATATLPMCGVCVFVSFVFFACWEDQ